ncbi:hypothetical protein NUW58_g4109 [Xylaria curta]|uniref:Uncharacterized protein n=1 Tax=Xylaria curta TaxID=42375 RepID=A0ACC1P9A7_9PEZI|nr:hypothetical protein NUW58_g4109 [Xylaria curta]
MLSTISSSEEAKALVESICRDNGYMDEVALKNLSHDNRQAVEALLTDRAAVGNSATALAKKLHGGDGRFVESLLRNADDNQFTRAQMRKEDPFVTFKIAPSRITVECNEDGFTQEDLRALCAVGKSTKTNTSRECFSREGIGFKSVFVVACKVHIESGHLSFSFNHQRGQRGMGMISPTWEVSDDSPPPGVTRISLFLDPKIIDATENSVTRQFEEIEAPLLLFLRNIHRIDIVRETDEGVTKSAKRYSITQDGVHLTKLTIHQDGVADEVSYYYVTKHIANQVPQKENRLYPEVSIPLPKVASSQVILAFPLDETASNPVAIGQQVFAFTPIGNKGFKFLIQADFATQNGHRDVDATSSRNQALLGFIAAAFSEAMIQLRDIEASRYRWMRYLPQSDDHCWNGYWKQLCDMIKFKIGTAALMFSSSGIFMYTTGDIKRLPPIAVSYDGDPIFGGANLVTPSNRYQQSDLDCLKDYGLETLPYLEIIKRAEHDLRERYSPMYSSTSDQWHTAAAQFLSLSFEKKWEKSSEIIRSMRLIPVVDSQWVSAASITQPLSFAKVADIEIPRDLPLTLISPSASENPTRAALFERLGARYQSISHIRKLIFNKYPAATQSDPSPSISEDASLEHLKFLYLTRDYERTNFEDYERITVCTDVNVWRKPLSQTVYMADNHRYSVSNILKTINTQHQSSEGNPSGLKVPFLSSCYTSSAQWQAEGAWADWLRDTLNIRIFMPLRSNELIDFFRIISKRRSDEFVGILQFSWPQISNVVSQCKPIRDEIADYVVPIEDGFFKLKDTYLPYLDLVGTVSRLLGNTTSFPFLNFSNTLAPKEMSSWEFLSDNFGVTGSKDVGFYLDLLVRVSEADRKGTYGQSVPQQALEIYRLIYKELNAQADGKHGYKSVRYYFEGHNPLIFLPIEGNGSDRWKKIDNCRWDCPSNMKSLFGIRSHYAPLLQENGQLDTIMAFMKEVVGVLDLSPEDIVNELRLQKKDTAPDEDLIRRMYVWLAKLLSKLSKTDKNALREIFRDDALIFAAGKWCTTSACVWSSGTNTLDKIDLSHHYTDTVMSFVTMIGVPTYTLEFVYNKLQAMGTSHSTTVEEVKQQLWRLNSLLLNAKSKPDPRPILESPVFPVRSADGYVRLLSADKSNFAIVDKRLDKKRFYTIANILDFSLNEVHRLGPFLEWAGLNERLLSAYITRDISEVGMAENAPESQNDIKSKAYSLCRIAVYVESPRAEDPKLLYKVLRNFKIFESPPADSQWYLTEGGITWNINNSKAMISFNDSEPDTVVIYIPTDASDRKICFLYHLPLFFLNWMDGDRDLIKVGDGHPVVALIAAVLNTDPSSAELLLDREGVTRLEFPADSENQVQVGGSAKGITAQSSEKGNPPMVESTSQNRSTESVTDADRDQFDSKSQRPSNDEAMGTEPLASSVISTPTTGIQSQNNNRQSSAILDPATLHQSHPKFVSAIDILLSSYPNTSQLANRSAHTSDARTYVALLDKVILQARVALFHYKDFDISTIQQSPIERDSENDLRDYFTNYTTSERWHRIQAAGEFYVFGILSALRPELPGFTRDVWKSDIRDKVAEHPAYHYLRAPRVKEKEKETSDIVYADAAGVFTATLIKHGYLDEERWGGHKPKYYIEVRTTIALCDSGSFSCSSEEYTRMCAISRDSKDEDGQEAVVIIFRVFNFGKNSMSYRIFVDPVTLEKQGVLIFRGQGRRQGWSVVPGRGSQQ